jgi:hypothetical protein
MTHPLRRRCRRKETGADWEGAVLWRTGPCCCPGPKIRLLGCDGRHADAEFLPQVVSRGRSRVVEDLGIGLPKGRVPFVVALLGEEFLR